jgi:hypothetical protein
MGSKPASKTAPAEPTAVELAAADQARVETAIRSIAPTPAELEQDPQQAAVDAAVAELHRNPPAALGGKDPES